MKIDNVVVKGMKVNNIAWNREQNILCVACRTRNTSWEDGVCSVCTNEVPDHIPYPQHRMYYVLKNRKKFKVQSDANR